jgi:hypothetical protein
MNPLFRQIIFVGLLFLVLLAMAQTTSKSKDQLESRFLNPPTSVKPYMWWHWMGSNFSREGITKDIEVLKPAGLVEPVRLVTELEVKL